MEGVIIKSLLPSCPLIRFNPENLDSAIAYVRMLLGQISPTTFLEVVATMEPQNLQNAMTLVNLCVGVAH